MLLSMVDTKIATLCHKIQKKQEMAVLGGADFDILEGRQEGIPRLYKAYASFELGGATTSRPCAQHVMSSGSPGSHI
jgi:hypothetical protein